MTTHPAAAAFGANSSEMEPPAENRPICTFEKSKSARSETSSSRLPNSTVLPIERSLANAWTWPTGKFRWLRISSMDSPTTPVAPTTAMSYVLLIGFSGVSGAQGTRLQCWCLRTDICILCPITQVVIHDNQRHHGFGNGCRAQPYAGIVTPFGHDFGFLARLVDRFAGLGDTRRRLQRNTRQQVLSGRDATQRAACIVFAEA